MNSHLDLQLENPHLMVGDRLSGQFIWLPENPDKIPKKAEINLSWFTEGRGTRDQEIEVSQILEPETLMKFQKRPFPFSLDIPIEVPITYNGYLFRVMWEVEVKIVFSGLLRPKERAVAAVQILPRS